MSNNLDPDVNIHVLWLTLAVPAVFYIPIAAGLHKNQQTKLQQLGGYLLVI